MVPGGFANVLSFTEKKKKEKEKEYFFAEMAFIKFNDPEKILKYLPRGIFPLCLSASTTAPVLEPFV